MTTLNKKQKKPESVRQWQYYHLLMNWLIGKVHYRPLLYCFLEDENESWNRGVVVEKPGVKFLGRYQQCPDKFYSCSLLQAWDFNGATKLFLCVCHENRQKHNERIWNCYFSKHIYTFVHQPHYLNIICHIEKQV